MDIQLSEDNPNVNWIELNNHLDEIDYVSRHHNLREVVAVVVAVEQSKVVVEMSLYTEESCKKKKQEMKPGRKRCGIIYQVAWHRKTE